MIEYYAFCDVHGVLSEKVRDPKIAKAVVREHLVNVNGPHGKVFVVESYKEMKYGQELIKLRKY